MISDHPACDGTGTVCQYCDALLNLMTLGWLRLSALSVAGATRTLRFALALARVPFARMILPSICHPARLNYAMVNEEYQA